jgi:hypothetical protein
MRPENLHAREGKGVEFSISLIKDFSIPDIIPEIIILAISGVYFFK